jgi:type I restriction enzyme, S subunit
MKNGWLRTQLSDVASVQSGSGFPDKYQGQVDQEIPFYKVSDMNIAGNEREMINENNSITEEVRRKLGAFLFPKGSIIFPKIGGAIATNKKRLTTRDCCVDNNVMGVIPKAGQIDSDFLYYFFLAHDLSEFANEAHLPSIKKTVVEGWEIILPTPLPEQQRIVGILDEAFEGIATAKANAEKNLQNARALFESHLQSVFTQRGSGWMTTTLGAEIDLLAGFAFKSAQYTDADGAVRLLRGDNIVQGVLRWDDVKRWPANDTEAYDQYQLSDGDVVLAMDRPWVKAGLKHATISADDLPCLLVQRTARLRGGVDLDNRFLMYLIGSAAFTRHILGIQTGIGVPHISGQQIKDFEFPRPPIAEQRRIADNLEALRAETQRLASLYQRKLAALEALKKSLLHQAFTGNL